jgi:hypothetical protein
MLMVAVGFGVLVGSLSEANYSVPFTLGALFGSVFIAVFTTSCSRIRAAS